MVSLLASARSFPDSNAAGAGRGVDDHIGLGLPNHPAETFQSACHGYGKIDVKRLIPAGQGHDPRFEFLYLFAQQIQIFMT
jgi:hypothetical protein